MGTIRPRVPAHLIARARRLGGDAVILLHEAHSHGRRLGRREGADTMRTKASEVCRELLALLERMHDELTPAQVAVFHDTFDTMTPDPLVAAYFGAASDHLNRCLERLRKLRVGDTQ